MHYNLTMVQVGALWSYNELELTMQCLKHFIYNTKNMSGFSSQASSCYPSLAQWVSNIFQLCSQMVITTKRKAFGQANGGYVTKGQPGKTILKLLYLSG